MRSQIIQLTSQYNDLLGVDIGKNLEELFDLTSTDEKISDFFIQSRQKNNDPSVEIALLTDNELIDISLEKKKTHISMMLLKNIRIIDINVNDEKTRIDVLSSTFNNSLSYFYEAYSESKQLEIKQLYKSLINQWRIKNV